MLGELAKIKLLFERLAEEAAVAVHHDHVERVLSIARSLDHLLEDGSPIVACRGASFDEFGDDRVALATAPGP